MYLEIKHIPQNTLDNIKKTVDKFISLYDTQYIDSIKFLMAPWNSCRLFIKSCYSKHNRVDSIEM